MLRARILALVGIGIALSSCETDPAGGSDAEGLVGAGRDAGASSDAGGRSLDAGAPADAGATDAGPPPAADVYVSPTGNDGTHCDGPGSLSQPLATPDCARQKISALGANGRTRTVAMRGGLYPLSAPLAFAASDTGSKASPILWQAWPGEQPVISAGRALPTLTTSGCSIAGTWCTTLSPASSWNDFQLLYARKTGDSDWERRDQPYSTGMPAVASYGVIKSASGYGEFQPNNAADVPATWTSCFNPTYTNTGARTGPHPCRVGAHAKWDWAWQRIASLDTSLSPPGVVMTGNTIQNSNQGYLAGHKFLVQNVREVYAANAASFPGGWYLDQTVFPWVLYYTPTAQEVSAGAAHLQLVAPQLTAPFVTLDGANDITFQGVEFAFGNFTIPANGWGGIQFDAPSLNGLCGGVACGVDPAVRVKASHHVVFDRCTVAHNASAGLMFTQAATGATPDPWLGQFVNGAAYDNGANNIIIEEPIAPIRPTFTHSDATVAHHVLVQNNILTDCCKIAPGAYSVLAGDTHDTSILNNEVAYTTNSGIGLCSALGTGTGGFCHDNKVDFNDLHDIAQSITNDIGCVYTLVGLQKDPTSGATLPHANNEVAHNVCHDVWYDQVAHDGYGANGIYLDQNSTAVSVTSNLIYRTSANIFLHEGQDHVVENNVLALPASANLNIQGTAGAPVPFVFTGSHNVVTYAQAAAKIQSASPEWSCATQCSAVYALSSNLYFEDTGAAPSFRTDSAHSNFSLSAWQACPGSGNAVPCEDTGSKSADPQFANPRASCTAASYATAVGQAHCFDVTGPNASGVGYVPWDYSLAGVDASALVIARVPTSFPTPASNLDYGQLP